MARSTSISASRVLCPVRLAPTAGALIISIMMDMMSAPAVGASRTGQSTRLAEIEVLRAIAVLMVLMDHVPINLLFWHSRLSNVIFHYTGLWTGVDLFFAI